MNVRLSSLAVVVSLSASILGNVCSQASAGTVCKKGTVPQVIYSPNPPAGPFPQENLEPAIVEILVNEKGEVAKPKVLTSSGSVRFDYDAMAAVLKWRFTPGTCDGLPTTVRLSVEIAQLMK
jgi:TonB family protein